MDLIRKASFSAAHHYRLPNLPRAEAERGAVAFVETYARLINSTATGFEREGKRYLTVASGCTGGKHRSVAIAEELARRLRDMRLAATAQHRDLGRE